MTNVVATFFWYVQHPHLSKYLYIVAKMFKKMFLNVSIQHFLNIVIKHYIHVVDIYFNHFRENVFKIFFHKK